MSEEEDVVLGVSRDGCIVYKRLSAATLDDAIRVFNVAFYPHEPLCVALQVAHSPQAIHDLNELFTDMSQDLISVVAVESATQKVVGVCFNKLETKLEEGALDFYEVFKRKKCKEDRIKFFVDFMGEDLTRIDLFEKYSTNAIVDLVGLTVLPTYKRRGIGQDLMECSLKLVHSMRVASAACIICSSTYTLHIAKKLGFTELFSIPYSECIYDGRPFSDIIQDHSRVVLVARKLSDLSSRYCST